MRAVVGFVLGTVLLAFAAVSVVAWLRFETQPHGQAYVEYVGPEWAPVSPTYTVDGQYVPGGVTLETRSGFSTWFGLMLLAGTVLFVGALAILLFLWAVVRRTSVRRCRRGDDAEMDETRMMQEIYRSLGRMEERIEALETLLLDRPMPSGVSRPRSRDGIGRGV